MLYLYLLSIPYGHPFVKRYCFLSFLLAFHTELGSDILEKNAFFFDCNILRCTQKSPFSLHFLLRRWFPKCFPLLICCFFFFFAFFLLFLSSMFLLYLTSYHA